jgi:hypothetical protein
LHISSPPPIKSSIMSLFTSIAVRAKPAFNKAHNVWKRWWKISSVVNIILKWQNTCNEWATRIWWSCPSIEIHLENKVFKFSFNISNCSVLSFTSSASITPTLNQNFNTFYQTKLITTNFKLKYFRFQQKKFIPKIRISTRLIFSLSEQK